MNAEVNLEVKATPNVDDTKLRVEVRVTPHIGDANVRVGMRVEVRVTCLTSH